MKTIVHHIEHEIAKRKGSRFLAALWPLTAHAGPQHEQVKALLAQRRANIPAACHHCWAMRTADGAEQCSDDGEPHSTAGKPILAALQRADVLDVFLVVSRVFGGVKLGTGGLTRAYGAAATELLATAEVTELVPSVFVRVRAPLSHVDTVKRACTRTGSELVTQKFAQDAEFLVRVPTAQRDAFRGFVQSKSSGLIQVMPIDDEATTTP
ncbi:TPA: hypothetical protein N0F65_011507 [Lagenidium giganteum]|uniref:Impact N-terminal domain-containing protein n=1 Tax=Lagenidium giganteum TaxID=4803 RepID=A0AAV2Z584_9STRA|nr:TPA: hypothetical protein N0F65_011507 [Lagenidium giganteum]